MGMSFKKLNAYDSAVRLHREFARVKTKKQSSPRYCMEDKVPDICHWETGKTGMEEESEPGDLLSYGKNNAFGGKAA